MECHSLLKRHLSFRIDGAKKWRFEPRQLPKPTEVENAETK